MTSEALPTRAARVQAACGAWVYLPDEPEYAARRVGWNLAADQRPAAVAVPSTVDQVARLVRAARASGLTVAPQTTGHGAGLLVQHDLTGTVLVRLDALAGVHIDPATRIARVDAGTEWEAVVDAAADHGLAALHGSSPNVGVVGYTLGGGLSFYARKFGLAANSVTAVEMVTGDGEVIRADASHEPDLFWAIRGAGGANFGIVTSLEFELQPITDAYAGFLLFPIEQADAVVRRWVEWTDTAPDEVTTSLRIFRFPPLPELPPFLSGRRVLIIDGAVLADDADAERILRPLRDLGADMDTFGRLPAKELIRLHMDPEDPIPSVGAGQVLDGLDDAAVEAFLAQVGPDVESPLLFAELRQLGGAIGRAPLGAGSLSHLTGSHQLFSVAMALTPDMASAGTEAAARLMAALALWTADWTLLNFAERPVDPATGFPPSAWDRLRAIRAAVDPDGVFLANHRIG
jgi:FAD/FMN-containing dehydrogenase